MNQKEYRMSRRIVGVKFYKESRNKSNVTHKEGQKAFRNVIAKLSFSNSIIDIATKDNECKLIKDIFTNLVIVKAETSMRSKTCSLKNIKKAIEKLEKHYEQY